MTWLRQQYPDLIPGPVALAAEEKTLEWEAGIRKMYTDFPTQWALANFAYPADCRECARQFLILQAKKVRSDLSDEAKAAAAQAVAKRAKRGAAPTATPASPASPATPRTGTAPATTANPRTSRDPWLPRAPQLLGAPWLPGEH